jgi:hypothetical protein
VEIISSLTTELADVNATKFLAVIPQFLSRIREHANASVEIQEIALATLSGATTNANAK